MVQAKVRGGSLGGRRETESKPSRWHFVQRWLGHQIYCEIFLVLWSRHNAQFKLKRAIQNDDCRPIIDQAMLVICWPVVKVGSRTVDHGKLEAIEAVWEHSPQQDLETKPLVREQRACPAEAESLIALPWPMEGHNLANFWVSTNYRRRNSISLKWSVPELSSAMFRLTLTSGVDSLPNEA